MDAIIKRVLLGTLFFSLALAMAARSADAAQPSQSKLRQMGLSGARIVADDESSAVRGMGWRSRRNTSVVWGKATFSLFGFPVASDDYHESDGSVSGSTFIAVGVDGFSIFAGGSSSVQTNSVIE